MNYERNFSLRLEPELRQMLAEVNKKTGLSVAKLVRQAVVESIQVWNERGYVIPLKDEPEAKKSEVPRGKPEPGTSYLKRKKRFTQSAGGPP